MTATTNQEAHNAYVIGELKELRLLIAQANSDHARERDELHRAIRGLARERLARKHWWQR